MVVWLALIAVLVLLLMLMGIELLTDLHEMGRMLERKVVVRGLRQHQVTVIVE